MKTLLSQLLQPVTSNKVALKVVLCLVLAAPLGLARSQLSGNQAAEEAFFAELPAVTPRTLTTPTATQLAVSQPQATPAPEPEPVQTEEVFVLAETNAVSSPTPTASSSLSESTLAMAKMTPVAVTVQGRAALINGSAGDKTTQLRLNLSGQLKDGRVGGGCTLAGPDWQFNGSCLTIKTEQFKDGTKASTVTVSGTFFDAQQTPTASLATVRLIKTASGQYMGLKVVASEDGEVLLAATRYGTASQYTDASLSEDMYALPITQGTLTLE